MADKDYVKMQAELIFRQWEFYQHLTWQVPTAAITMNGAVFALSKLLESSPLCLGLAWMLTGLLTVALAHRLHRASELSKVLLHELQEKFDKPYGVEGVVRMTDQMSWSCCTRISSRSLVCWVLFLWGMFLIVLALFRLYA
jgi:hypothetical protein